MICPICGFDMQDEKTCEKCGWVAEDTEKVAEQPEEKAEIVENNDEIETIEGLDVDLNEVATDEETQETEDEFASSEEDLVIDFDEIDNSVVEQAPKGNNWMVSLVSFLAGVLATLIVVGCFNGTIVQQFDKLTNGTPYDVVESFCKLQFGIITDADEMVRTNSPFFREQIIGQLEYYNQMTGSVSEVNLDIDVTNDKEYKEVARYYLDMLAMNNNQKVKITNLEFTGIEYYKSGSDEFEAYLAEYKAGGDELEKTDNISIFANVTFNLAYEVTTYEQETSTASTTTKKSKKNQKTEETTAVETTQAPTTQKESASHECSAICVKIDDSWYVFNGMQALQ